jgi:MFS-type transporter involved in bile tolerance (Atg22 family)
MDRFLFFALFSVIGKTSAFIGPFVSSAIIDDANGNANMPFAFLFGLCVLLPLFRAGCVHDADFEVGGR